MDVDFDESDNRNEKRLGKRPFVVPVDDAHPFDLEAYMTGYTGRTAVDRLIQIISICPTVAPQALQLAVERILTLRDPNLYHQALSAYEHVSNIPAVQLPPSSETAPLNHNWLDETTSKNQAERNKLEVELKTYTSNMIKESIRMAHRDLGDFYLSTGDFSASLKHFTKSRESCTTSQHVLDMYMSIIELLILQRNYSHISTYVFKADAALDGAIAPPNGGNNNQSATSNNKKTPERIKWQSKLDLASALSQLGQGNYDKAANSFLNLGSLADLGDWIGKLVAPGDIAIFGTLCALASLPRSSIKSRLLQSDAFLIYIEYEPYVRELLEAYMNSKFSTVLELLERYSTRHHVDIYLSSHMKVLMDLIRSHALVLYFQPFSSIKLDRMATAFGWTVEHVEQEVVELIQSGAIRGRIDSQNKILKAKETDARADLFTRASRVGKDVQATNRKLLLRMRLQQADLIVKAPKGQHTTRITDFYPE